MSMKREIVGSKLRQFNFTHQIWNKYTDRDRFRMVPSLFRPTPPKAEAKDRIAQFNISIGDRVLVRSGKQFKGKVSTVTAIHRKSNTVELEEFHVGAPKPKVVLDGADQAYDENEEHVKINTNSRLAKIHYSNIQLVVGSYQVTDPETQQEHKIVKVAESLRSSKPCYNWKKARFDWTRVPTVVRHFDTTTGRYIDIEERPGQEAAEAIADSRKTEELFDMSAPQSDESLPVAEPEPEVPRPQKAQENSKGWLSSVVGGKSKTETSPNDEPQSLIEASKAVVANDNPVAGLPFAWPSRKAEFERDESTRSPQDTLAKGVQTVTFMPLAQPWRQLLPELAVPYSEFGNTMSRARRQEAWNVKHRDPNTWRITRKDPKSWQYGKNLARVNWKAVYAAQQKADAAVAETKTA